MTTQHHLAQLYRARLSHDDFGEAIEYLAQFESTENHVTKRALLTAAIVSYCRPFTNNRQGSSNIATHTLSVKLSQLLTAQELLLHESLMSLRNEAVAHTKYARKPVKRLSGSATGVVMSGKLFDLLSERLDVSAFAAMCRALQGHCFNMILTLNKDIVSDEGGT